MMLNLKVGEITTDIPNIILSVVSNSYGHVFSHLKNQMELVMTLISIQEVYFPLFLNLN